MQSLKSLRKQMAWLFAVVLALAVPSYAAAQNLGVQGGVSFSTFKTEDSESSLDRVVAPAGGLYLVFGSNSLTGRADVIYSVRGAKSDFGTYRLTYLEIPLGAQFQFARTRNSDVHVLGGTSIGIKLDAKLTQPDDVDVALDNEVEDFDLGIFVGAGMTFGRFVIDGRYTHGVRNINVDAETPDVKNRSFAIMFGMRLN